MKEIEVKVLKIDKEKVEKKILSIGGELIKDEYQHNYTFDTEDRYLKHKYNGYLRIRKTLSKNKEENIELTLKRNIPDDDIRKNIENNLKIDNLEEGVKILEALGYKLMHTGKKHRKSFKYKEILFEIDTWDKETYPHTYMEIEISRKEDLDEAVKLLGLEEENITKKSLEELRDEEFSK
jgi:adenylate cyclase class 2